MNRAARHLATLAALLAGLAAFAPDAAAYSNNPSALYGRTAKTGGAGCAGGGCHGSTGTGVVITGPLALDKGQTGTYAVTLTRSVANGTRAGVAIAASDGLLLGLASGMPTILQGGASGNEVIHATSAGTLRTVAASQATYTFTFSVPAGVASGASYTLYAAGVVQFGGGFAHAANFVVKAKPTAPTFVIASSPTATTINVSWAGTGPRYRVVYKPGAAAPTSETDGTTVDVGAATTTTVTGLTASTQYSFAVYSKLNPDNIFSSTAGTTTGTTTAPTVATRQVNAATGANTGDCTNPASPCKTITYAMAQAAAGTPGDSVSVAPGTYNMTLGESFPIVVKSGVRLKGTGDPTLVIVDAAGANTRALETFALAHASTLLEGFTITNGLAKPPPDGGIATGGGLRINGGAPTIRRNIFVANSALGTDGSGTTYVDGGDAYGGAIFGALAAPTIVNNIFRANVAQGGKGKADAASSTAGASGGSGNGGAIYITGPGGGLVANNTFHGNSAVGGQGGASLGAGGAGGDGAFGALFSDGPGVDNNIFANNFADRGAGGGGAPAGSAGTASHGAMQYSNPPTDASNNLFHGNKVNGAASTGDTIGTASLCYLAPGCASVGFGSEPLDLRIGPSSPAAGAGIAASAPSDDFLLATRANPPSIGAYEAASIVYNVVLEGYQQVGPYVATLGTGGGTATYDMSSRKLTLSLAYSGLAGSETMAHIHGPAARGANAGVLFTLAAGSPKNDVVTLTLAQQVQLYEGEYYVNMHTSTYANGEIRGQLDNIGPAATRALAIVKAGTGSGTVTGITEAGTVVSCGLDCGESIPSGKTVTLTAVAAAGTVFTGWSGGGCAGVGTCTITMDTAKTVTASFSDDDPPRLVNIATRMRVLTGDNVLIGGFIIGGSANKTVVVRARGPSLAATGVPNVLANPMLEIYTGQSQLAVNDNWADAANAAQLQASGFAPANALESAIMITLAPGAYTALVTGVGGTTGVGIVEVFEVDLPSSPLVNIATRGQVLTGADVMIAGLIIQGDGPQTVVVRARGPSLVSAGLTAVLADPVLQLFSGQTQIAANDDWGTAANAAQLQASGFAPANNKEAAILITLQPGAYTAIVTGSQGGTGVGIVEVFKN